MDHWTGFLRLAVQRKKETTIASEVFHQGALKVTPAIYFDDPQQPCFYLMSLGGGYVDGDRYKLEIHLGEQAQMLLTTQSATKIFKTINHPAIQEMNIVLERGSYLEYMPDPVIAYEHAQYQQNTIVHMNPGSVMIYGDIITPGWSPDGNWFCYHTLQIKTQVYLEEQLVVFDHLQLRPANDPMAGIGLLEGYTHLGSMIVIGERTDPELMERLSESLKCCSSVAHIGLSTLMVPGFSLRVLAYSTQDIEKIFRSVQKLIREHWFGKQVTSFRKY
ncbi:urease accessory protein UreD [Paenibacillus antarcticus]|uniref:Urease accessory protein UreD n=1 Tax=Paenibacillus antarcticus TaxID=253703 RepID=A0A168QN61_9BACL|nr:urease accessory protein UreD [Paenibacillus antarcticus]OAB47986.1 urease accessory protein UreD [Paenibacillus antarcticus]